MIIKQKDSMIHRNGDLTWLSQDVSRSWNHFLRGWDVRKKSRFWVPLHLDPRARLRYSQPVLPLRLLDFKWLGDSPGTFGSLSKQKNMRCAPALQERKPRWCISALHNDHYHQLCMSISIIDFTWFYYILFWLLIPTIMAIIITRNKMAIIISRRLTIFFILSLLIILSLIITIIIIHVCQYRYQYKYIYIYYIHNYIIVYLMCTWQNHTMCTMYLIKNIWLVDTKEQKKPVPQVASLLGTRKSTWKKLTGKLNDLAVSIQWWYPKAQIIRTSFPAWLWLNYLRQPWKAMGYLQGVSFKFPWPLRSLTNVAKVAQIQWWWPVPKIGIRFFLMFLLGILES